MTRMIISGPVAGLIHLELDVAVAMARKHELVRVSGRRCHVLTTKGTWARYTPCSHWGAAGALIGAYRPSILWPNDNLCNVTVTVKSAEYGDYHYTYQHHSTLVALCRAVVAAEMGTYVDFSVERVK